MDDSVQGGVVTPKWVEAVETARREGSPGVVLVYNTADAVYAPATGVAKPMRLKQFLAQYLSQQGYATASFALASGLQEVRPHGVSVASPFGAVSNTRDIEQVLSSLTTILRSQEHRVAIILDYADHVAPSSTGMTALLSRDQVHAIETLHGWGVDDHIRATANLVILLAHENQVNDLLTRSGGFQVIPVDLPTLEERGTLITVLAEAARNKDMPALLEGLSPEQLAAATGGLRNVDIAALFRHAAARRHPIVLDDVRARKAKTIRQLGGDLVEVFEPSVDLNMVGGIQHVKDYIQSLAWRVRHSDPSVPQALLLQGPPGVGKSYIVQLIASVLGYACLALRNVRDRWVGASERNLELVLWLAETLAPCLIWLDEVDQLIGQRTTGQSADAGTSERMLARIWEFLGSLKHRGRILWVATTNRPDLLDPAMLDRFQVTLPFLHPTASEIAELLPVVAKQLSRELAEDVDPRAVAAQLGPRSLMTVRALQEIVATAAAWGDEGAESIGTPITRQHLLAAVRNFKPTYNVLEHELIGLVAVRMTSFQSLLPWMTREGRRPGAEVPYYLQDLVNPETGVVDHLALEKRIQELQTFHFANRLRQSA